MALSTLRTGNNFNFTWMNALNVEIKARCTNLDYVRDILTAANARFVGMDHQVDTYYQVPNGRLKLRHGNIENALIYYERSNTHGPKQSEVKLFRTSRGEELNDLLEQALETFVVVDKKREIYFIDNIKFHLDQVKGLGEFVEIEAIDENGAISNEELLSQCRYYMEQFNVIESNLVSESYSDLIASKLQRM